MPIELPEIASKEVLSETVESQRNLLRRWLRLIREPSLEDVQLLERETAEVVGELANRAQVPQSDKPAVVTTEQNFFSDEQINILEEFAVSPTLPRDYSDNAKCKLAVRNALQYIKALEREVVRLNRGIHTIEGFTDKTIY